MTTRAHQINLKRFVNRLRTLSASARNLLPIHRPISSNSSMNSGSIKSNWRSRMKNSNGRRRKYPIYITNSKTSMSSLPCGYLTHQRRKGIITEANLTAVALLATDKSSLLRSAFSSFILPGRENVLFNRQEKSGRDR